MAEKSEIIDEIERLTVHCRPPLMEASARGGWLSDWCDDLADFPIDSIRLGIREWRHAGSTKFPTAGQLLPLIRGKLPANDDPRPDDWRPLTDEEFARLSIREKIRHHLILAHDAGIKAGPMWKTPQGSHAGRPMPGHIEAKDMPETWSRWKSIEANHLTEVKRLREIVRRPMAAE